MLDAETNFPFLSQGITYSASLTNHTHIHKCKTQAAMNKNANIQPKERKKIAGNVGC